jgi:hypothetical protein
MWSPSYFASSCGGAPLSVINEYIKPINTELKPLRDFVLCITDMNGGVLRSIDKSRYATPLDKLRDSVM